jgi:hypothetical protein
VFSQPHEKRKKKIERERKYGGATQKAQSVTYSPVTPAFLTT